jgi:hypothetical protein
MGETSDLIAIYGAVDKAVQEHPDRRAAVARVLPLYRRPAVHWFDQFEQWMHDRQERAHARRRRLPTLQEALNDLAKPENQKSRPRMRARRLLALAALTQALPDYGDDPKKRESVNAAMGAKTGKDVAKGAPSFVDVVSQQPGDGGRTLRRRQRPLDEAAFASADALWAATVQSLAANKVLDNTAFLGHRPCSGRLIKVTYPFGAGEAAVLETQFETSELTFDRAITFLDPGTWHDCNDFWCQMDKVQTLAGGARLYSEKVALDCNVPQLWSVTAQLVFTFRSWPDPPDPPKVAVAEYHLAPGHPQPEDDVFVDEGSLVVRDIGTPAVPRLRVTTTKRVMFSQPFTGEAIAMMMCACGYGAIAEDFVFACAEDEHMQGLPFPGEPAGAHHFGPPPAGAPLDAGAALKAFTDQAAASLKACVDDYAEGMEGTRAKIAAGHYTAADLSKDVADTWGRAARETANAVDLGARSARAARGKPSG